MSRAPGKKFKIHEFDVEGMSIPVEIRITPHNEFYAEVDDEKFQKATFAELKDLVLPRLQQLHKLVYDPVIEIDYNDPEDSHETFYGKRADWRREKVDISFTAGWVSRTPISTKEDRYVYHRWIETKVNETTCALGPLDKNRASYAQRMSKDSVAKMLSFTPDRWRRLTAIVAALTDVRGKIAFVLRDTSGTRLDALPPERLLEALPVAPTRKRR